MRAPIAPAAMIESVHTIRGPNQPRSDRLKAHALVGAACTGASPSRGVAAVTATALDPEADVMALRG